LLFYSKGGAPTWNQLFEELPQKTIDQWYNNFDEDGRRFNRADLTADGTRAGSSGKPWRGIDPTAKGRHWAIPRFAREIVGDLDTLEALDALDAAGRVFWPKKEDGIPMLKRYIEDSKGVPALDVITEVAPLNNATSERLGYPTQKPEALLERILRASSNEGDLVLDCFCGSGTTAAVAEKLNRRWIACDLGRFAIHTTRKRLLQIPGVRPFVVQNLGKYERQLWQSAEFVGDAGDPSLALGAGKGLREAARQRAYVEFILRLYNATPLNGYTWLHGTKGGRLVHVGSVEAPVSVGDVKNIAAEFKKAVGTGAGAPTTNGVDLLGWDFAFELNEVAKKQAEDANIRTSFKRIPKEVMDRRATPDDVKFFELAALGVTVKPGAGASGLSAMLTLADFVIPPDDVPEDVRQAVKHWSQWIDYWAVDWDNKGDAFHNEWQAFRTRREPKLPLSAAHTYGEPGEYRVVVKVIDILGNDTTKTVKVKVK
jgi:hypothetical protein